MGSNIEFHPYNLHGFCGRDNSQSTVYDDLDSRRHPKILQVKSR